MTRWIENASRNDVLNGTHSDMGVNALLIQIGNPATFFPDPKYSFKEVHQFEFLDAEEEDDYPDEAKITDEQARRLVEILRYALDNSMNVLVHCNAGICRSGAVVEVASMLGFTPTDRFRQPNLLVKHKMMNVLGWTYEESNSRAS